MPAKRNVTRFKEKVARLGIDLGSTDRYVSEAEAAILRGISVSTFQRRRKETKKPKRYQLSARRFGYKLSEVMNPES
jgi:predicted DNA-binding transcriptional regulator AlpA